MVGCASYELRGSFMYVGSLCASQLFLANWVQDEAMRDRAKKQAGVKKKPAAAEERELLRDKDKARYLKWRSARCYRIRMGERL